MKIAIYSPYLDTFGGGERYILTIAEYLSVDYSVDLLFDKHLETLGKNELRKKLSNQLSLDLSRVNLVTAPLGKGSNFLNRLFFLKRYDVLFYLTDGSIFYSTAKKNIIHFQVPFNNIVAKSWWGKVKLVSWNLAIFNSEFTKKIVQRNWPIDSLVIYPPVDTNSFKLLKKEKIILSVGRFFDFLHSKKQEILVEAFKKMVDGGLRGWKLQLAGGTNESGREYLDRIKALAKGFPIEFYPDVSFADLKKLYGHASIYWHAAGLGEEEPTKMEHFGITVVEAMSAGCVPIVISKGGLPEIVVNKKNGYLFETTQELQKLTLDLISDQKLMRSLSQKASIRSKMFSKEEFNQKIVKIVSQ